MANSSQINTEYETYKATEDCTAISLVLSNKLDYRTFLRLNEGRFKIIGTTYYLIKGLIYLTKYKDPENPEVYRTDTRTDDKIEKIAILAASQNINSDTIKENDINELRDLVESQGNLSSILNENIRDRKKLNQPLYEANNKDNYLYENGIIRW